MSSIIKVDQIQDSGGNTILSSDGSGNVTQNKTGITQADQWRLSSNQSITGGGSGSDVTANWERVDEPASAYIGTGMTESSGIFTFPETGIYKVESVGRFTGTSAFDWGAFMIYVTKNNSSYDQGTENYTNKGANQFASAYSSIFVDVTDTTQVKVKFAAKASANFDLEGSSVENHTYVTFIRLGDT